VVFLRMEKTASASFIWVNGKEVGYNEGAQEPAEYNITKYLKSGKNTIAVNVYKYSDGYYLEGQDYWRLAGIFDDVWLLQLRLHISLTGMQQPTLTKPIQMHSLICQLILKIILRLT